MASMRMKVFGIVTFWSCLVTSVTAAEAVVRTVCPSGCAYQSIQAAVDSCQADDVVSVGPGTYLERVIFGPATPSITVASVQGPDVTVIDGSSTGRVVTFSYGQAAVSPHWVLDGFTIQNGMGGGIDIGAAGDVTIANSVIRGNWGTNGGGVTVGYSSTVSLVNCTISGNSAGPGGVYAAAAGGILAAGPGTSLSIVNSTISGNDGVTTGGILLLSDTSLVMRNTIVWGNTRVYNTVQDNVYFATSTVAISFSDVGANVHYPGQPWPGPGNILADPLFVDPRSVTPTLEGDYHLGNPASPCIDAGDPESATPLFPVADIDGETRPNGLGYDIGSDEYGLLPCGSNLDCTSLEFCEKAPGACEGPGSCQPLPTDCSTVFDPVCGCDGLTHTNDCTAASVGVSVDYPGACCTGPEVCNDGLDNDCDGLIDAADLLDCPPPGCSAYASKDACVADAACAWQGKPKNGTCVDAGESGGTEICTDGIDNDGDGKTDCADRGDCRKHPSCVGQ